MEIGKVATPEQIQEILNINAETGLGHQLQELINRYDGCDVGSLGRPSTPKDVRGEQAMRYFMLGVGRELGFKSLRDYLRGNKTRGLAPIPEIPQHTLWLPKGCGTVRLLLVEPRVELRKLCAMGLITYEGLEDIVPLDDRHAEFTQPTWILMTDGRMQHGRPTTECLKAFEEAGQLGLTALQGVCAYLQDPEIVCEGESEEAHALCMPGSVVIDEDGAKRSLCLDLFQGELDLLVADRVDLVDEDDDVREYFGAASRFV